MIKIGLSGNRYSGKDMVSNLFIKYGVPVFDADTILRFILNYNYELLADIRRKFGNEIFFGNSLNFDKIKDKNTFNNIIDMVEDDIHLAYKRFNKKYNEPYTIFSSSILFERNWNLDMDMSISVFSPSTDRIKRCRLETDMGILTIGDLLKCEMCPLEKNIKSDYIIHNYNDDSSVPNLLNQVSDIDKKIINKFIFNEQTRRVL